jgi:hypothetical protein
MQRERDEVEEKMTMSCGFYRTCNSHLSLSLNFFFVQNLNNDGSFSLSSYGSSESHFKALE